MVSIKSFRELALSLPTVSEQPHFDRASFRVNKKIFATLDEKNAQVNVMLSVEDQDVFCTFDKTVIYPVPNKWGLKGATTIELNKVKKSMLADALKTAYAKATAKK